MKEKCLKRVTMPNQTLSDLEKDGWFYLGDEYNYMLRSILNMIQLELERLYWNEYQEEMSSPFENSGAVFENEYVTIRAYDWNENILPNFDTDKLKIFWYKHSNRGVEGLIPPNLYYDINEVLLNVLNETIQSLKETFEKEDKWL